MASKFLKTNEEILAKLYEEVDEPAPYDEDGKYFYFLMAVFELFAFQQCCGSMTFWCGCGSGSADLCFWLMDPDADPDPDIFTSCQQKLSFNQVFLHIPFLKIILHSFSKIWRKKKSQNKKIKVFINIFDFWYKNLDPDPYIWLMDPDPDLGGPKTRGSGGSGSGFRSGFRSGSAKLHSR